MRVRGLDLLDGLSLTVEPSTLMDVWREASVEPPLGGISPDILARVHATGAEFRFLLIETKTKYRARFNANQRVAYPNLIHFLEKKGIDASLHILHSVGCSRGLYEDTKRLQTQLGGRFGLLLWEDVFRVMHSSGFAIPGLDTARLLQFTEAAGQECKDWSGAEG
jgi:hypothetical protein